MAQAGLSWPEERLDLRLFTGGTGSSQLTPSGGHNQEGESMCESLQLLTEKSWQVAVMFQLGSYR